MFLRIRVPCHILTRSSLQSGADNKIASTLLSKSGDADHSSFGVFMIQAFVKGSHWVLEVVDVDGIELFHYDPMTFTDILISIEFLTVLAVSLRERLNQQRSPTFSTKWMVRHGLL